MTHRTHVFDRLENSIIIRSVRGGLLMSIPVLMIGAFALILKSLPITLYKTFIKTFLNSAIFDIVTFIYNVTFGLLPLFMTVAISITYARIRLDENTPIIGAAFVSA